MHEPNLNPIFFTQLDETKLQLNNQKLDSIWIKALDNDV